jgi:hypothetical protein
MHLRGERSHAGPVAFECKPEPRPAVADASGWVPESWFAPEVLDGGEKKRERHGSHKSTQPYGVKFGAKSHEQPEHYRA